MSTTTDTGVKTGMDTGEDIGGIDLKPIAARYAGGFEATICAAPFWSILSATTAVWPTSWRRAGSPSAKTSLTTSKV